jgi:hypothetical protein
MTTFTTEERMNADMEPIPFMGMVPLTEEKIRVFRCKLWEAEDTDQIVLSSFYAQREFIEQLPYALIIEDEFYDVNQSDLDNFVASL